ncbi:MAG TPA: hypothetical protein VH682_24240, partial [Gemmataceae bacterium]
MNLDIERSARTASAKCHPLPLAQPLVSRVVTAYSLDAAGRCFSDSSVHFVQAYWPAWMRAHDSEDQESSFVIIAF